VEVRLVDSFGSRLPRQERVLLKHWQAYQAGRPPQDRLLARAEARFFDTLFVNPDDPFRN